MSAALSRRLRGDLQLDKTVGEGGGRLSGGLAAAARSWNVSLGPSGAADAGRARA